jgi:hypothetical protein
MAETSVAGWPGRPGRAAGSRSDKKLRHLRSWQRYLNVRQSHQRAAWIRIELMLIGIAEFAEFSCFRVANLKLIRLEIRLANATCRNRHRRANVSAWRGFLSLRDPAGASHAAGPPDCVIAH